MSVASSVQFIFIFKFHCMQKPLKLLATYDKAHNTIRNISSFNI